MMALVLMLLFLAVAFWLGNLLARKLVFGG